MKDYIKNLIQSPQPANLLTDIGIAAIAKKVEKGSYAHKVSKEDDFSYRVKLKENVKGECHLKEAGSGQLAFVTFYEVPKKEKLAFHLGSVIWNDNKRGSHHTCAYITQKNMSVIESHVNLEWGLTEGYLISWSNNYLTSIKLFQESIDNIKEHLGKLPKSELNALEKATLGVELAAGIWSLFQ